MPSASTPKPRTCCRSSADPDPALELDLAIGLGTAQRQTGDPSFRQSLLDAAHQAIAADDTERLVAAALANNRGMHSSGNGVDVERGRGA